MEMLDLKQVVLTRKSTSPAPQYFLEITATDQVHGFPEVYRYTDLYHPDLSFMSLWLENQVQTLEQENAKRVILTFGDEITLKVEKWSTSPSQSYQVYRKLSPGGPIPSNLARALMPRQP